MNRSVASILTLVCLTAPPLAGCSAPAPEQPPAAGTGAEQDVQPAQDPNARYLTPEGRADAMEAFELESRADWQMTERIMAELELTPGMVVADIGAGTGYFTRALAREVGPDGVVWAVDITPEFLEELERQAAEVGLDNIHTVLSTATDPRLPPGSVELAFIGDTYHHFGSPEPMLAGLHQALQSGGRLAIVDWQRAANPRFEESGLDWEAHIRLDEDGVVQEVEANGFRLLQRHDFLEWQSFLVFEKQ